jgi:uncharacterized membrane protein YjfL (UPF0719 family)
MLSPYELAFAAGTPLVLVVVFLAVQRAIAPMGDVGHHHPARAVLQASYVFGVLSVSAAVVAGCVHGRDLATDLVWAGAFGASAVVLLVVTARLGTQVLLRRRTKDEITRGNVAAAIGAGSHYVATSILLARCLYGDDLHTLGVSIVFFAIAQGTLHLFLVLFRALTSYDDFEEIASGNVAAALSYGGITVALAMIVGRAAEGTFTGWKESLEAYGAALLYALALYPVRQVLVQALVLRSGLSFRGKGRLDDGIGREKDVGLGALEAAAYLATAFFVSRLGG